MSTASQIDNVSSVSYLDDIVFEQRRMAYRY